MSNINNHSASDLIYLFLDGKTDSLQKKQLFSSMAEDSGLQSEFQDALNIRNAFAADKEDVRPPATLTAAVFASAGFSSPFPGSAPNAATPAPQPVPVPATSLKPFFSSLISKLSNPFITGALSTVATAAVILMFVNPILFNSSKVENKSNLASNNKQVVEKTVNPAVPLVTSTETQADNKSASPVIKEKIRYIYITKEVEKKTDNNLLAQTDTQGHELALLVPSNVKPEYTMPQLAFVTPAYDKFQRDLPNPMFDFDVSKRNTFSLEFRGVSNLQYFPKRSIEPQNESLLNNISAALLLNLDKHNRIGFEVGQESFQMYSVRSVDSTVTLTVESGGQTFSQNSKIVLNRYEKIPSSSWFGAKYKYTFDNIINGYNISPFSSVTAGYVSNIGLLLKPALGMTYNPENTFFFSLGLEYSALFYKRLNNIHSPSSKVAFFYNMGYQF